MMIELQKEKGTERRQEGRKEERESDKFLKLPPGTGPRPSNPEEDVSASKFPLLDRRVAAP